MAEARGWADLDQGGVYIEASVYVRVDGEVDESVVQSKLESYVQTLVAKAVKVAEVPAIEAAPADNPPVNPAAAEETK